MDLLASVMPNESTLHKEHGNPGCPQGEDGHTRRSGEKITRTNAYLEPRHMFGRGYGNAGLHPYMRRGFAFIHATRVCIHTCDAGLHLDMRFQGGGA